jgi:hypothetical protein
VLFLRLKKAHMKKSLTKVFIVFFLASATILGCKKEEAALQEKKLLKPINKSNIEEHEEEEPSEITTLKTYMAERINADASEISYNSTTEQFVFRGVDQFSKADLQESYSTSQFIANIDRFTVTSGTVVNATTPTTTINFTVRYLRQSIGTGGWGPFEINVKLGVAPGPSAALTEYLSSAYNVTSSNFSSNNATLDVSYSVTVNDTQLPNGYYLVLDYNVPNNGNTSYQRYGSYAFQIQNGASPALYFEGTLYRTNDEKVYSIMDGYARHIENWVTLAGVYNYSGAIVNCFCSTLTPPVGTPIGYDTSLLRNNYDGKMYFREGNYLRHIVSALVADSYHFKITDNSTIMNVNGVSGYTIGPPIQ